MARTRTEWNSEIDTYAAAAGLSNSAVAAWKVLRDLCVSIAMFFESILELFKTDVNDTLTLKQFGTLYWYVSVAKEFQEGDDLSVVNGIVGYETENEDHRIVSQASAKESEDGVLALKVAKTVGTELAALSTAELDDFRAYMAARKSPGVRLNISSSPPDTVKYIINVLYDPLYDYDNVESGLNAALGAFRDNFRFDATLYESELVAALSAVSGVVSLDVQLWVWDTLTLGYLPITVSAELGAGYFNWSNSSSLVPAVA